MFEQLHLVGEETKGEREKWNTKVKKYQGICKSLWLMSWLLWVSTEGTPQPRPKRDAVCIEVETRWGQDPATGQNMAVQRATKCACNWGQKHQKVRLILRVPKSVFKNPRYFSSLFEDALFEHEVLDPGIMRWAGNRAPLYSHSVPSTGKRAENYAAIVPTL